MSRAIAKIGRRLRAGDGFTLVELLIVVQLVGILTMLAVPSYLSFRGKAEQSTAETNVRSATNGAEMWYASTTGGNGTYTGLMRSKLILETPGVAPSVKAVSLNAGAGYCIEDTDGPYTYDFIGGVATPVSPWKTATVQATTCLAAAGTAALST